MAEVGIHIAEMIQIVEDERGLVIVAPGALKLDVQFLFEAAPGERAGQAVGRGKLAQFQLVDHQLGKVRQNIQLGVGQLARLGVDGTQGADVGAVLHLQRHPGVEPHMGRTHHQRVVGEPFIQKRVRNDEGCVLLNGMGAKGIAARGLLHIQPDTRLEPLPIFIDERDQHDGHAQGRLGQPGDPVERLFWRRVQDVILSQRRQALAL